MEGAAGSRTLSGGTMLDDKYRIEHLLAAGGMGAVYLGTHVRLRKRVAIKVLNPQLSTAPMVERLHREAIAASQIGHEGIVQVTDLGTSLEGEPFLVMEYLEGESLGRRLAAGGRLAVADACELGCAILSPLAAAHRAGIIHRDLKPDNVFLVRQSRGEMVKLLDFGISRTAGPEGTLRLTMTGLVLGTPYYMSPEQARGESEITPAADLYAFGVMLYEMLIGQVPIRAENYNAQMYRVMIGDFARPRDVRPDLPRELEDLILRAMAQSPDHRPASAESLERALLAFCRPVFREHATGGTAPGVALKALLGQGASDALDPARFVGPTLRDGERYAPPPPTRDTLQDPVLSALTAYDELEALDRQHRLDGHPARPGDDAPASLHALPAAMASCEAALPAGSPRRRRTARLLTGLAIVMASAVAAGSLMIAVADRGSRPVAPVPAVPAAPQVAAVPAPAARALVVEPTPAQSPTAPDEAPAARDTTITLRFAVTPADAVITLDGARVQATDLAVT
ncbi:MAG TPA: serine/threonine-protein kinase, partial [Kofleriaceae bacterium]|nr:serine/threonine-protein kinase [Kofleriaceae bacterium]